VAVTHLREYKTSSELKEYALNAYIKDEDLVQLFNDSERDYDKYQVKLNQALAQARPRAIKDISLYFILKNYIRSHRLYSNYEVFKINVSDFNKAFQEFEFSILKKYQTGGKSLSEAVAIFGAKLMEDGYPHRAGETFYDVYKNWKLRQKAVMREQARQKEMGKAMALGAQQFNPSFSIRGDVAPYRLLEVYDQEVKFVNSMKALKVLDKDAMKMIAQRPNTSLVTKGFGSRKTYDLSGFELSKFDAEFSSKIKTEFKTNMKDLFTDARLVKMINYSVMARDLSNKYPTVEALGEQLKIKFNEAIERQKELTKLSKKDYSVVMYSKLYEFAAKIQERKLNDADDVSQTIQNALTVSFAAVNDLLNNLATMDTAENQRTPMTVLVANLFRTTMEKNLTADNEILKAHYVDVMEFYDWIMSVFIPQLVDTKATPVSVGEVLSFKDAQHNIEQYLQNVAYQQGIQALVEYLAKDQYALMSIRPDAEAAAMTRADFIQLLTGK